MISRGPDQFIRLMVLGDSGVGKTSLIERYTKSDYTPSQPATIGIDYRSITYEIDNNKSLRVQIWDTAGQEIYRSLASLTIRDADGILLVYDTCNSQSFHCLEEKWLDLVRTSCKRHVSVAIVANKVDLEKNRAVTIDEGQKFAKLNGYGFFETSAKDNTNVNQAFNYLIKDVIKKVNQGKLSMKRSGIVLEEDRKTQGCDIKQATPRCCGGS